MNKNTLKKPALILSCLTISVIACLYGIAPSWFFGTFLGQDSISIDQAHILRAVTTLYLSLGLFWLYCAFREDYQDVGILLLAIFCGGLVIGRILSVFMDGMPSPILLVYIAMELGLVPVCLWLLKK
ncbi:MAG: DUF4345 domain-containing protein [Coraliomargarita sp.]